MKLSRLAEVVHNVIAHPLLEIWPRFGVWLHAKTEEWAWSEEDFEPEQVDDDSDDESLGFAVPTDRTQSIQQVEPPTFTRVNVEETWPPFEPGRVVVHNIK